MARVTVTIEGTPQEVRSLFPRLAEWEAPVEGGQPQQESQDDMGGWSEEAVQRVWNGLTSNAKKIVEAYLSRPDAYPWSEFKDDMKRKFGWSHFDLGGAMSSFKHQMNKHGLGGLPHPLQETTDGYRLHPAWLHTLRHA